MRVIFENSTEPGNAGDLPARISAARQLAGEEVAPGERPLLLGLAELLQASTPPFFLLPLAPPEIARFLLEIFRFLEHPAGEPAVAFHPLPGDRSLLLTNTVDAPYLVHTVQAGLVRQGISFQVVCHPLLAIDRSSGRIAGIGPLDAAGERESLIVVLLQGFEERQVESVRAVTQAGLEAALVAQAARPAIGSVLAQLGDSCTVESERDFIHWLREGSFIPFAYRRFRADCAGEPVDTLPEVAGSALGLANLPPDPDARQRLQRHHRLVVETTALPSPILANENLVYVGIAEERDGQRFEHAFWGLFSEQSTNAPNDTIPALRQRIEAALARLGIPRDCHDWRKTMEIVNTFPKVELFFISADDLVSVLRSFTQIYRHGNVKVVITRSLAVRGLTLLLIMPREFYGSDNLARIEKFLGRALQADDLSSRVIHISNDYLSLHVSARPRAEQLHIDQARLERGLTRLVRPWDQRLLRQLHHLFGEQDGRRLWRRYGRAFSREYRTLVHPRFAMRDLQVVEKLLTDGADRVDLWGPFPDPGGEYCRLQFYSLSEKYLNDLMPILENLGLCVIDEVDFALNPDLHPVYIKSFAVRGAQAGNPNLAALRKPLLEAFLALHRGDAENDYLNRLLIPTGLDWQQIDVFRGYRNYYFQLGSPFTKKRVAFALINNPEVARLLYDYFAARFFPDPRWEDLARREEEGLSPLRQELVALLEAVADPNEDRILRTLFNLIDSTVRTNFFSRREQGDYFFAFKISALGIIEMPAPRPLFEIYVHAATMEGIHLRGGKVARGGIRWSDRPDDFRTEILGLMKTQMTKNALIVPVGSKGGFVVKQPVTSREEGARLSRAAYQVLMRGLLDLTDNRVEGKVITPDGIVAYDDPDPYLVVAADKGTAQFSDTANAISRDYGFWLDDAFASGGSHGYDHKVLGITARGAWEGVRRHFQELGVDIQKEAFTVVGIGDMSGDVFGNGMLLSPQIRLLAAFDHRHVFLDPNPDPETSFAERQRLFNLPRSSWDDYDRALISPGGGIFPRDAKEIPLSDEVRRWLGVRHDRIDVAGLIRLLLCAEVDLLWNGGIGTYVKAVAEKNEDAGDRANDLLRVDGAELRAKVVGEGGNLGFTQRGRIEYALHGGRINTDAVDNSGGVDCSDHEVNLKILMQGLLSRGELSGSEERNQFLADLTDDVVEVVLANNRQQGLCLSLDQRRCAVDNEPFFALTDRLTQAGLLDRRGEFLPTTKEVLAREGGTLSRPELAILMAYSKMQLYATLLEGDLPDREALRERLASYFPPAVVKRYGADLSLHPLAREICATVLTNEIIGQAGSAVLNQLAKQSGAPLERVVETYLVFDAALDGRALRQAIAAAGTDLPIEEQYRLLLEIEQALNLMCEWALMRNLPVVAQNGPLQRYRELVTQYLKSLGGLLREESWSQCRERAAALEKKGFDQETAQRLAGLAWFGNFLPLVELLEKSGGDLFSVSQTFTEVRDRLGIDLLVAGLDGVPLRDRWDRLARQALGTAFQRGAFQLTLQILAKSAGNPDAYFGGRRVPLRAYQALRESLRGSRPANFHPFTVLSRALEALIEEDTFQESPK